MNNGFKILLASFFLLSSTVTLTAQDIPQKATDAFAAKYAEATDAEWESNDDEEGEKGYEVEFTLNGVDHEATYTAEGVWLYTQKDITEDALPEAVKSILQRQYSDLKIDEVAILETPDGMRYKIEAEAGKNDRELLFNEDGTKLKETTEEEEDDSWFN